MLKREIGEVIRRELPVDEAGLISVNEVMISADLQHATVYVSILGTSDQQKRGGGLLHERRVLIQNTVGRAIVLKYTPQLRFVMDDSIARGNRVLEILDDIEKCSPDHEAPPKNN